jgi:GT2 family glycosyltransferase
MNSPLVDVIILNWNLPEDTIRCVRSVLHLKYPNYQINVVDNGSTDESVQKLSNQLGDKVHLIVNKNNLGFGGGCNVAIKKSLSSEAYYTLLLNNDTVLAPNMLTELVQVMESDAGIGVAGPIIYYADNPNGVWFAGIKYKAKFYAIRRELQLKQPLKRIEDVDLVSGCGMLVRREVWETVGLFASDFFMYSEDADFSLRVQRSGFRLVTATQAKMWHRVSASTGGSESPMKQYYQVRSSLLFYRKHTTGLWFLANIALRCGHAGWTMLTQMMMGKLKWEVVKWYLRGVGEAIQALSKVKL